MSDQQILLIAMHLWDGHLESQLAMEGGPANSMQRDQLAVYNPVKCPPGTIY